MVEVVVDVLVVVLRVVVVVVDEVVVVVLGAPLWAMKVFASIVPRPVTRSYPAPAA